MERDDESSDPHRARDQLIRGYLLPTSLVVKDFRNTEVYLLSYSQDSLFGPINVSFIISMRSLVLRKVLSSTLSPSLCSAGTVALFPVLSLYPILLPVKYTAKTRQQLVTFLVVVCAIGIGTLLRYCLGYVIGQFRTQACHT